MADYHGPHGEQLSLDAWARLFQMRPEDMSAESWWRKHTVIDENVRVSTVWTGMDWSFGLGQPLYWETMVFGGEYSRAQWQYGSREAALDDHERIVRALRAGEDLGIAKSEDCEESHDERG